MNFIIYYYYITSLSEVKYMQICGLQKTTLLDYPGYVASTIFLSNCNFRCPFCHNGDLVLHPASLNVYSETEVLEFLTTRKHLKIEDGKVTYTLKVKAAKPAVPPIRTGPTLKK